MNPKPICFETNLNEEVYCNIPFCADTLFLSISEISQNKNNTATSHEPQNKIARKDDLPPLLSQCLHFLELLLQSSPLYGNKNILIL